MLSIDAQIDALVSNLLYSGFDVEIFTKTDAFVQEHDGSVVQYSMISPNRRDDDPDVDEQVQFSKIVHSHDSVTVASNASVSIGRDEFYSVLTSVPDVVVVSTTEIIASKELVKFEFSFSSDVGTSSFRGVSTVRASSDHIGRDKMIQILEFLNCKNIEVADESLIDRLASSLHVPEGP